MDEVVSLGAEALAGAWSGGVEAHGLPLAVTTRAISRRLTATICWLQVSDRRLKLS
ncbi:hypothetical protein ACVLV4_001985 [Rathayibacter agropyri]